MSMMAEIAIATARFMERKATNRHPDYLYLGHAEMDRLNKECEDSLTVELRESPTMPLRGQFRGMDIFIVDAKNHLAVGCKEL